MLQNCKNLKIAKILKDWPKTWDSVEEVKLFFRVGMMGGTAETSIGVEIGCLARAHPVFFCGSDLDDPTPFACVQHAFASEQTLLCHSTGCRGLTPQVSSTSSQIWGSDCRFAALCALRATEKQQARTPPTDLGTIQRHLAAATTQQRQPSLLQL